MADPTAEQKRSLAAGGYAMPDGSYYIRPGNVDDLHNAILAVGRATPNAGESDVARRNSVRRHIIKRANAKDINRPDMIPDTWNADGSLKHWDLNSYLAHYGVAGMRWGHRKAAGGTATPEKGAQPSRHQVKLGNKADAASNKAAAHEKAAVQALRYRHDLEQNGVNSQAFKQAFGKNADLSERQFYFKYGQTKMQAAAEGHAQLTRTANYHAKRATKLGNKATKLHEKIGHADNDGLSFDEMTAEEFALHYGDLGVRWAFDLGRTPEEHEQLAVKHTDLAAGYADQHFELKRGGFRSPAAMALYGEKSELQSEWHFFSTHGQSKDRARAELEHSLASSRNHHIRIANAHALKAGLLREIAELERRTADDVLRTTRLNHAQAMADANEHIKARFFSGEGADAKRNMIAAKIRSRSANREYKKAFDGYLVMNGVGAVRTASQNLSTRSSVEAWLKTYGRSA